MTTRPHVTTSLGAVRGVRLDCGVSAFLGMPYAEATSGPRRFGPPQPITTWGSEPLDASACGSPPPQFPHDRLHLYGPASEDCLWLNVWTPGNGAANRPVMVWIHGGGWLQESACDPLYFGHELAARGDVVVIGVEYRSNIFGFAHLLEMPGSGNAGLLDQLAALRWVRDHISAFGGNPENVTIFGESAGGMSVSALLGMPRAQGLFHRAIMQSNVASTIRRADFAEAVTSEVARRALGIGSTAPVEVEALRQLPWQAVLEAAVDTANDSGLSPDVVFGPVHDQLVFSDTPMLAAAAGLNADVPIMLGFTRHESRYWYDLNPALAHPDVTAELVLAAMATPSLPDGASVAELAELLRAHEPDMTPVQIGLAGLDDAFFRQPVLRQAEGHVRAGQADTFLYRFDWEPSVPRDHDFDYGSPHAADLGFTLGTAAAYPEMYGGVWPSGLADTMMDTWIAFARTGKPDNADLPEWPPYDLTNRPTMIFDARDSTPTSVVEHDPDPERRRFWQKVPFDGLRPAFTPTDLAFTT